MERALRALPGVEGVQALPSAGRVTVQYDARRVTPARLRAALAEAGHPDRERDADPVAAAGAPEAARRDVGEILGWGALALVALLVLLAALGESLGIFDAALDRLPWWVPALAIALGGWRVFQGVARAALGGRITSHTLMTSGVIASAAIGQWTTAALIVFFMRFADWLEDLTTTRSRRALAALTGLRPARARVLRAGGELEVPVEAVRAAEIVVVRPGERIPVDGRVVEGAAPVDQAAITGESLPVDKAPGHGVFAATVVQAGFLKIEATRVGTDTTFARIVRLVEEAEAHKAPVQRFADRFSGYYLPAVLAMGVLTYFVTGQVVNAVAVLVVACACAIAMATPVVVLASVGRAARHGLLVKGGIALERLAKVDAVVMDKTGTVTCGEPAVTDVVPLDGGNEMDLLCAVAAVESRSEHPLARAVVRAALAHGLAPAEPDAFTPLPGRGLLGTLRGEQWAVGNRRLLAERGIGLEGEAEARAQALEAAGKTVFFVANGRLAGLVAVADVVRPEAKTALAELRQLGIRRLLLLTGDNGRVAAAVASELDVEYRADLLPEDKIAAVRVLQGQGAIVMMVGDGINDGPALAQADVGVAMGATGTAVAVEAADVALMRDDWHLVPEAVRLGRRAARTVRQNLGFTAVYNVAGIALAAIGLLPPVWAAAAQSLPDVAIMLNSSRLLRR